MMRTLNSVKSAPFSPKAKKRVQQVLPSIPTKELDDIYKDSSEERRKKKAEEEKNKY